MISTAISLTTVEPAYAFQFSICTLVNNLHEYAQMKSSFEACGFTEGCEYLYYDNSQSNFVDAYQAVAGFLKQAKGRYLLIVHQDVRCLDPKEHLVSCLADLTKKDSKWAICGNAGCNDYHEQVRYLENAGVVQQDKDLPRKVKSLDENLLIINNSTNITISGDLTGYHLYGTDLCLIADFLGYTSYVIPFMVHHFSMGGSTNLKASILDFRNKYGRKLRSRYVETTCTRFYLSNGESKTFLYNLEPVFSFVKTPHVLRGLFRKMRNGKRR